MANTWRRLMTMGLRLLEVKSVHLFQKLILHFYDRDFTLCITHSFDYMTMHLSTMHLITMTMHLLTMHLFTMTRTANNATYTTFALWRMMSHHALLISIADLLPVLPELVGSIYLFPLLRCNRLKLSRRVKLVTPFFGSQALTASAFITAPNTALKILELLSRMRVVTFTALGIDTLNATATPRHR